ncbi:MAG: AraC family transcriptional regulator [Paludibacteraceae bacterium]|nr:AraC family transcriptional regulator [Paludibacteraceae bacterium]
MNTDSNIPIMDCPYGDYMIGDASGKLMNEYGRFPCKINCGVYALLVQGTASATVNITDYSFQQNDVLIFEPGSFLFIHDFSDDALVYWIVFGSSFLEKHTYNNRMSLSNIPIKSPKLSLSQEQADVLCSMYDTLIKALNAKPSMLNSEKMTHVFYLLQSSYASYIRDHEDVVMRPVDRKTEIYHEYCQLVVKHYHEWHHVNQYAQAMRITLPHLCTTVRQVSERTAGDVINDAILTDAKAQLKISNLQIKEIALSLGFENIAFFNRFFKSHVGVTPKTYRTTSI